MWTWQTDFLPQTLCVSCVDSEADWVFLQLHHDVCGWIYAGAWNEKGRILYIDFSLKKKNLLMTLRVWVRFTHLFELQLRIDSDVADLTVEGAFLSVGVRGQLPSLVGARFKTQARVSFYRPQATPCLQNGFVLGTWKQRYHFDRSLTWVFPLLNNCCCRC